MKILNGNYTADEGQIFMHGKEVRITCPGQREAGHRHRVPGTEPAQQPYGGREHLPGPRELSTASS